MGIGARFRRIVGIMRPVALPGPTPSGSAPRARARSRIAGLVMAVLVVLAGWALAREAPAATLYALAGDRFLLQFDSAAPQTITRVSLITGLQTGTERIVGIDFRPRTGQLYALTVPIGSVGNAPVRSYTVNPLTGAATFVGAIPASIVPGAADVPTGLDFNPTVDRIRLVHTNDENYRANPNNGTLSGNDPNLNPAGTQIEAEAYDRNFDRANAATIPTTLYGISRALGALVTQGGINGSAPGGANGGGIAVVGPLGVALGTGGIGFDIDAGGTAYAAFGDGTTSRTGLYTINLTNGAATLVGTIADGTVPITGLAAAPRSTVVVGVGAGASQVNVLDPATGGVLQSLLPFGGFAGGARVALGDVNGDGVADVIVGAGPGGGPQVRVFDGRTGLPLPGPLGAFFAFDVGFTGGVYVAAGDINGDGYQDVIVGADAGGGPQVRAFSGATGGEILSFFAYGVGFTGGVRVAAADFNLDGRAEIVTAPGPGGGPNVSVFDNTGAPFTGGGLLPNSFFPYDVGFTGGVYVAAGDVNGDGRPDIVTAPGAGGGPHVKAFSGVDGSLVVSFFAYSSAFGGGVRVAVADVNRDGRYEILTVPGPGGGPEVRAFDAAGTLLQAYFAFDPAFTGGVFIGGLRR